MPAKYSGSKLISLLLKKGQPFAIYSLPGQEQSNLVVQKNQILNSIDFDQLNDKSGFVIAAFDSYFTGKILLLQPDWFFEQNQTPPELECFLENKKTVSLNFLENNIISESEYLVSAKNLIKELKSGALRKVVFSRVIAEKLGENFSPDLFYQSLVENYPEAFVYLFHLPGIGFWTGASPEPLLRINQLFAETVSLAGTRLAEDFRWTDKEIEEQQIVTDFIKETITSCGIINFEMSGPETVSAGKIVHLKTTFKIPTDQIMGQTGNLVQNLHPTPAVCGLPKEKAFNLITSVEKHNRRFYTGFLGPCKLNGQTDLFVNLRCAEIGKFKMNIYVGGGFTADSIAGNEWEETVRKSKTLLVVAENFKTFDP